VDALCHRRAATGVEVVEAVLAGDHAHLDQVGEAALV